MAEFGGGRQESYVVYLYFEHNENCVQGGGETMLAWISNHPFVCISVISWAFLALSFVFEKKASAVFQV